MKQSKTIIVMILTLLAITLTGCPKLTQDEATINIIIKNIDARTVLPDVTVSNLTDIKLKYIKTGTEEEVNNHWDSYNKVKPVAIETGTYDFTLTANCSGFQYKGTVENFTIASGSNNVIFNLNLTGIDNELTGNGTIRHTITFPVTTGVNHVTAALYQYDSEDNLIIKNAAENVTVTDNEDGTYTASYTKEVPSGEYVLKYRFYADEAETLCQDEYSTVIYVLKDLESKADESTDRLCSVFSVAYELNNGEWTEGYSAPVQFTALKKIEFPAAEKVVRPGYDFVKWSLSNNSSSEAITEYCRQRNIKVYAIWKARTDTEYKVKYFYQNIEDDNYTEDTTKSQTLKGTTDTTTSITAEGITGFKLMPVTQVNINGKGNSVVNIYYNRNVYKITFILGNAVTETELSEDGSLSCKYGAPVTIKNPVLEGYRFTGWINENSQSESLPLTFAEDRTFIADFERTGAGGGTDFSVVFNRQDVEIDYIFPINNSIAVNAVDGYSKYEWTVNGIKHSEKTKNITFSLDDSDTYRITLKAEKKGIMYSTEILIPCSYKTTYKMVPVITEAVTITGDQSSGVFRRGRTVTLSPYYMGNYQVTQKQYNEVMGTNPSWYDSNPADGEIQKLRPVEGINWYRAIAFCNKLSIKEGLELCYSVKNAEGNEIDWAKLAHSNIPTSSNTRWDAAVCDMKKNGYRLPTDAEWEFAARGGDQSKADWNYEYAGSDTIDEVAWYDDNSGSKTHEVGKKKPNRLGLYDMSGNVWEWCWDWYDSVNSSETVTDPTGAASGSGRVRRGGSFKYSYFCAVDNRYYNSSPYYYSDHFGFRLVRSSSK